MKRSPKTTTATIAWPFQRVYVQRGVAPEELLTTVTEAGIDAAVFADPRGRIPTHLLLTGVQHFIQRLGCPELGILAGQAAMPGDFGELELAARASATPREALDVLSKGYGLLSEGVHLSAETRGEILTLRVWSDSDLDFHASAVEFALLSLKRLGLGYLPNTIQPLAVRFTHAQVPYAELCEEAFECPAYFSAVEHSLDFPLELLDVPILSANPITATLMSKNLAGQAARSDVGQLITRIEDEVRERLASGVPTLNQVVKALGVSERTLHRKLQDADTSYRQVCDHLRKRLAVHALRRTTTPIKVIAAQLGYGDVHAFHRAFKRMTGETPGRCRAAAGS